MSLIKKVLSETQPHFACYRLSAILFRLCCIGELSQPHLGEGVEQGRGGGLGRRGGDGQLEGEGGGTVAGEEVGRRVGRATRQE